MYLCRERENNGRHTPKRFTHGAAQAAPFFCQKQSFEGFGRAWRLQIVPCENKFNIAASALRADFSLPFPETEV
jgi:hypothetical protein